MEYQRQQKIKYVLLWCLHPHIFILREHLWFCLKTKTPSSSQPPSRFFSAIQLYKNRSAIVRQQNDWEREQYDGMAEKKFWRALTGSNRRPFKKRPGKKQIVSTSTSWKHESGGYVQATRSTYKLDSDFIAKQSVFNVYSTVGWMKEKNCC